MRALWIEILEDVEEAGQEASRPVRALWIEISSNKGRDFQKVVEAREGLVD